MRVANGISLRKHGKNDKCLYEREVIPHTKMWTTPKREIRKLVLWPASTGQEALWFKLLWIGPEIRMPVRKVRSHTDDGPFRDVVASNLVVLYCLTDQAKGDR